LELRQTQNQSIRHQSLSPITRIKNQPNRSDNSRLSTPVVMVLTIMPGVEFE
jgi:hypothetical protein